MCDGDKALVLKERTLTKIAKRNMEGIVPLFYNMKKAKGGELNPTALYNGMEQAFKSGNIGPKSNLITIVHNNGLEDRAEADKVVKWLTMEVNFTIDYAKTLYMPVRPKTVDEIIKKHTKGDLPSFFVYAKDKDETKVAAPTNSTMCRIAAAIPSPYVKFSNTIKKFDYRKLMNLTEGFDISEDNIVIQAYDYWVSHQHFFQTEDNGRVDTKQEDAYMYQAIRDRIIAATGKSIGYIVNTLVAYLYTVRKSSQKKMLWACFGDVIVGNLKNNLANSDPICPICGRRFKSRANANRLYCSDECLIKSNVLKQSARNMKKY